jgi:predicted dehydrogenase/threonine dehydrogenase-like Zn-dependent dehydrogenase
MLVKFGKSSLIQKARSQPDKVREVLCKIRTAGFVPTVEAVFRKLDQPLPLGYCNAGVVVGVGSGVIDYRIGDRVASNGPHAEFVSVPHNLVARIPPNVSDDSAAFTVIGAIGLQGIRLAKPELGETFVVVGLGLIGQLTAQLLQACGCRVIGFDFDQTKVELARGFGIDARVSSGDRNPVADVIRHTSGVGCDGVVITASSQSSVVISQAAQMSRKRGRIVLIGVVGLDLNRSEFYEKELSFQVSCSYGPGRYEENYENKGLDYPLPFVRWTENRNFGAVLDAMADGALSVESLISRRVPIVEYSTIYDNLEANGIASLFIFDEEPLLGSAQVRENSNINATTIDSKESNVVQVNPWVRTASAIAIIGAGNFAKMTALPALAVANVPIKMIVSASGVTGTALAKKYSIGFSSTDFQAAIVDPEVRGVVITTRHNLHCRQTVAALTARKNVLVEKPLCLSGGELNEIDYTVKSLAGEAWISVGYNRRFSPLVEMMERLLRTSSAPISILATMNPGTVPMNHWVHDPEIGGGRLLGEACHFIDLAIYLTGSLVAAVSASDVGGASDCASILLRHCNGSTSVVNYLSNGHRNLSKERVEAHSDGRSLLLDDFRELRGYGFKSFSSAKTKQDKGHMRQFALFAEHVKNGGGPLIPWPEIMNSTRAVLAVPLAITERRWVDVNEI